MTWHLVPKTRDDDEGQGQQLGHSQQALAHGFAVPAFILGYPGLSQLWEQPGAALSCWFGWFDEAPSGMDAPKAEMRRVPDPIPADTSAGARSCIHPGIPGMDASGHHGLCSPTLANHCWMYQA